MRSLNIGSPSMRRFYTRVSGCFDSSFEHRGAYPPQDVMGAFHAVFGDPPAHFFADPVKRRMPTENGVISEAASWNVPRGFGENGHADDFESWPAS